MVRRHPERQEDTFWFLGCLIYIKPNKFLTQEFAINITQLLQWPHNGRYFVQPQADATKVGVALLALQ